MVRYTIEGRLLVPPGRTSLELPFFYERVHQIGTEEKRIAAKSLRNYMAVSTYKRRPAIDVGLP